MSILCIIYHHLNILFNHLLFYFHLEMLTEYFSKYGKVKSVILMSDPSTGRPRGFGFIDFEDPSVAENLVNSQEEHIVDNKAVDVKRAVRREREREREHVDQFPTQDHKLFVGGVSIEVTEEEFKHFFEQFGPISQALLMFDKDTGRARGFGFVKYESAETATLVLNKQNESPLVIGGKAVDIKIATPRPKTMNPMGMGMDNRQKFSGPARGGRGHPMGMPNQMGMPMAMMMPGGYGGPMMHGGQPGAMYGGMYPVPGMGMNMNMMGMGMMPNAGAVPGYGQMMNFMPPVGMNAGYGYNGPQGGAPPPASSNGRTSREDQHRDRRPDRTGRSREGNEERSSSRNEERSSSRNKDRGYSNSRSNSSRGYHPYSR